MAITYLGSASAPADNGTQAGPGPVTITPVGAMVDGDLVVMFVQYRGADAAFTISNTGGQNWNALTQVDGASSDRRTFWCRFNGTWAASPTVTVSAGVGTGSLSLLMHVFRPTTGLNQWAVNVGPTDGTFATPTTPFTVTIAGLTPTQASNVTIAGWFTVLANTWGTLAGAGWVVTGTAQYRNLSGSDTSATFAHQIQTVAAATGSVSKNQGGTAVAGSTTILTFYELDFSPIDPFGNCGIFGI